MKALSSAELPTGWLIRIEFAERGKDRKRIVQDLFYPRVPMAEVNRERGTLGDSQKFALGTVHAFGSITLDNVIRFMPRMENVMQPKPLKEALKTGLVMEMIRQEVETDEKGKPQFMIMGYKTPITVIHKKNYVMTEDGWFPAVLMGLKAEMQAEEDHAFIKATIAGAKTAQELFDAFQTFTVSLLEKADKRIREVVELPEAQGHTIAISETGQIEPANAKGHYRSVGYLVLKKWAKGKLDARRTKMAQALGMVPF